MSLINQMLKDLEQRAAGVSDVMIADVEFKNTSKLEAISQHQPTANKLPLIKFGVLMILLTGGAYLVVQSCKAIPRNTVAAMAFISNLNPQAAVTVKNKTTEQPLSATIIATPNTTNITENSYKIESHPLFATELTHTPIAAQSTMINANKRMLNANNEFLNLMPAQMKPVQAKEPVTVIALEKLPEKTTAIERIVQKSAEKSNMDNISIGKQIGPEQKSANFYRQAINRLQQGRVAEAQANLVQALDANQANQEARQMLAGLLVDNNRNNEAKATLVAGLSITPEQSDFRMALARLQVEAGDRAGALNTLDQGLIYAKTNPDYQSFYAALLQRAERHVEAIEHYMSALSVNNNVPNSLIGLGISLQAIGKLENAQEAFTRAQSSTTLSPELSLFVEQRLKQIYQRLHH